MDEDRRLSQVAVHVVDQDVSISETELRLDESSGTESGTVVGCRLRDQ